MFVRVAPRLAFIGCGSAIERELIATLRRIRWFPAVYVDISNNRKDYIYKKRSYDRDLLNKSFNWKDVEREFDVALIAVPCRLRGPVGTELLNSRKHVFMVPPLATAARACSEMVTVARRNKVALSVGLLRRRLVIASWMKALIASGTLGNITCFELREGRVIERDVRWDARFRPRVADEGALVEMGSDALDQLIWWLGDVEVLAYQDDNEGGLEADCVIHCRLKSGATGQVVLSRTRKLRNSIRVHGTAGWLEVHLYKNEVLGGSPNALKFTSDGIGLSQFRPQYLNDLHGYELKAFLKSVSYGFHVSETASESEYSVSIIEQCYRIRNPLPYPWVSSKTSADPKNGEELPRMPPRSKILVTGGRGFIGGNLIERLISGNDSCVRTLVRDVGTVPRAARFPIEIIRGDTRSTEAVERAFQDVNYVFHCAYDANSHRENIEGVLRLVDACAKHSVNRFVHVSTFAVYEPFPDGILNEDIRDGDRTNIYVDTKLELERIVLNAARERGIRATVVQPAVVYGPFGWAWTDRLAEELLFDKVILPDNGDGLCNAVYIDDLIDGMILAALSPNAVGERYILSGPKPVTWAVFFQEFARALGTASPVHWSSDVISMANLRKNLTGNKTSWYQRRVKNFVMKTERLRNLLKAAVDVMPLKIQNYALSLKFRDKGSPVARAILPSQQLLNFYSSKAIVTNEKARTQLGFSPRFDFERGMGITSEYLRWIYEDFRGGQNRTDV